MGYGNGGPTTAGMAAIGKPPNDISRVPLVALEMNRQAEAIDHLHSLIADLDVRLSAILRPDTPAQGPGQPATSAPSQVHPVVLANGLFDQNMRLEGACRRLQSMLDRVEL